MSKDTLRGFPKQQTGREIPVVDRRRLIQMAAGLETRIDHPSSSRSYPFAFLASLDPRTEVEGALQNLIRIVACLSLAMLLKEMHSAGLHLESFLYID